MTHLTPFADDSASLTIGQLTIENGTERIAIYGSLDVTCDQKGLEAARALKALIDRLVQVMEARPDLPPNVPPRQTPKTVDNPFE